MDAFLNLSLWSGIFVVIVIFAIPGLFVVVLVSRKVIQNKLTKQHERVGRLLFRVCASLLALLLSISFANEEMNYNKVVNSLEEEASLIASAMMKLKMHRSETAEKIREGLLQYVDYTIEDRWENVVNNPYLTKMMGTIVI